MKAPASDRNVVKLLALEKFNAMRAKQNNLTGVESATRRNSVFCLSTDRLCRDAAEIEHLKGTYEGGGRGLMMETAEMGINMFLQKASAGTLSVNLGYNYNTGYSAGINVGPRMGQVGVAATLGYTEKTGTNVGVGIRGPGMSLMYQEGHTLDGHGNVIKTHGWSANIGGVGISHDSYSGYGMSFTASQGFGLGGFAGGLSMTVGYNEKNGFSTSMDVDLEMLQGTNTWDQEKYNEIQNRQSQSSPFGNTPWDVVSNHFSNVFQGLGAAFRNGVNSIGDGWKDLFGGTSANDLDMEYSAMQDELYSTMSGDSLADANGMPSGNASDLARIGRLKTEVDAYLDYKEGKISKGEFDVRVQEARKNYYDQTQGERNKVPTSGNKAYTDISGSNLDKLVHLESRHGTIGRILEDEDGNVYFRTVALGMKSKSIQMEVTKITERPWTTVDPHKNPKDPGAFDLYAPYGSPKTVLKSDDGKFMVIGIKSMSEGGNSISVRYTLDGITHNVDMRHSQNQFPSYVIDQLRANPTRPLVFDVGTVVGWTGNSGQHGVGSGGVIKWDPNEHSHLKYQSPNPLKWRDYVLPAMGY